ncbi:MAG TPA: dephospho-CoA kinase [Phycisphaerales bacterium]|nr:dephospho-CoA kinase [Phycisphaerales bacterium]
MTDAAARGPARVPRELRPWVEPGDEVLIHVRPSPWAVLLESAGSLLAIASLAAAAILAAAAWARAGSLWAEILLWGAIAAALRLAWQAVVVVCRRYVLTRRYVLRVSGVFNRSAATLPLPRVQHVLLVRTLAERITGTGTLGFATAGTAGVEIAWLTVDRPVRLMEEVRRVVEPANARAHAGGLGASGAPQAPPVIGLAGGVGAGKSEVARAFARLGCVVADSDKAAREALDRPDIRARLIEWWGGEVVGEGGRIDRKRVAAIVFGDAEERCRLESLVHPIVRQSRSELVAEAAGAGAPAVIVDAPLLFEAGLDAECDAVVFVAAPREQRLERVRLSRGWDQAELDRREKVQLPLDEKRRRSDYEIVNDAGADRLLAEARRILDQILASRRGNRPGEARPDAG